MGKWGGASQTCIGGGGGGDAAAHRLLYGIDYCLCTCFVQIFGEVNSTNHGVPSRAELQRASRSNRYSEQSSGGGAHNEVPPKDIV